MRNAHWHAMQLSGKHCPADIEHGVSVDRIIVICVDQPFQAAQVSTVAIGRRRQVEYFAAVCFQFRLICTDFVAEHNVMNTVPLWVSAKAYICRNLFSSADAKRRDN